MAQDFEFFSRKFGLRQTSQRLLYSDVPKTARVSLFQTIFSALGKIDEEKTRYQQLYLIICRILKISWNWNLRLEIHFAPEIENLILRCEWYEFYEISQAAYIYILSLERKHTFDIDASKFEKRMNELFRDEFLGFEIKDGNIEKLGNPVTDGGIKEARNILNDVEFKSADELFGKAIRAFNIRPNPDVENCIKDAVAAIESIAKIVSKDEKGDLDNIIREAVKKSIIPVPLDQPITKLHAYRGNEPAIAHGGVNPSKVTIDEAEFVLAMSAAIITYLVKKRNSF